MVETYSEPSQTYDMNLLPKIVNGWKTLTIFARIFILDVWVGAKYASGKTVYLYKVGYILILNPIQDGHFWGCSRMGGGAKSPPLPKVCHTYPLMIKLGTAIPYPKKIQKMYQSRDTPPEFCWHQHFFTGNQQILLYQEIQI